MVKHIKRINSGLICFILHTFVSVRICTQDVGFKYALACVSVCPTVLYLTWLSDSGSHWNCLRSIRLSPGGPCVCYAMSLCASLRLCSSASVSMCVTAHRLTHMCMYLSPPVTVSASACTAEALQARPLSPLYPRGAVSLPAGHGFPCVTMITFTSTIKSRRTQTTVTHRGARHHHPQPPPLDRDEI